MKRIVKVEDIEVGTIYKVDFIHADNQLPFTISRCNLKTPIRAELEDFISYVSNDIWNVYNSDLECDIFRVYELPKSEYPQYYV
jgi:hypothetical protein